MVNITRDLESMWLEDVDLGYQVQDRVQYSPVTIGTMKPSNQSRLISLLFQYSPGDNKVNHRRISRWEVRQEL
jgi:hypothetical protein